MAAKNAIKLRAKPFDSSPTVAVEVVRTELDGNAIQVPEACPSSKRLHSRLMAVRCAGRPYQVEPISRRRFWESALR
jgi:hypothetical protein